MLSDKNKDENVETSSFVTFQEQTSVSYCWIYILWKGQVLQEVV